MLQKDKERHSGQFDMSQRFCQMVGQSQGLSDPFQAIHIMKHGDGSIQI
jgi:hypothetical protein